MKIISKGINLKNPSIDDIKLKYSYDCDYCLTKFKIDKKNIVKFKFHSPDSPSDSIYYRYWFTCPECKKN